MCEQNGCIKSVRNIGPEAELRNMKYGDIFVYNNRESMVINTYKDFGLYVAVRENDGSIVPRTLIDFNMRTGKFKHDIVWETDLSNYKHRTGRSLDEDMREAGL
ncbi:MAG: hypothetical protein ABIF18_01510 [archaeon]